MIIEVIGPSGIGKSYYMKNKSKVFKNRKFKYYFSISFLYFFIITLKLNYKHSILKSNNLILLNKFRLFYKKIKYFIFFNNNSKFKYYKDKNNIYIDEGIIGYFINLNEHTESFEKDFELYLRSAIEIPDKLIILIPKNKKTLFENMDKRKRWPRRNLGEKYFHNLIDRQISTIDKIIKLSNDKNSFLYNKFQIKVISK
jgi:hypothetical protein